MKEKQEYEASPPILLTFPSWEYDVASAVSSSALVSSTTSFDVSISTTGGGKGRHGVMPLSSSMSTLTTSTGSTRAPVQLASNHCAPIRAVTTTVGATPAGRQDETVVEVFVSGCRFTIPIATFTKLGVLPWEGPRRNTLRTCPKLFEILLDHMMFDSFPNVRRLSVGDVEELEPLALLLDLRELVRHLLAHRHKAQVDGKLARRRGATLNSSAVPSSIFRPRQSLGQRKESRRGSVTGSQASPTNPLRPNSRMALLRESSRPMTGARGHNNNNKLLLTARAQWHAKKHPSAASCEWSKVNHAASDPEVLVELAWMEIHHTLS